METNDPNITPPRLAERLLLWFLKGELAEEVLGDLDEKFYSMLQKHPVKKARKNYWYQVFKYIRPFAIKRSKVNYSNTLTMHRHFWLTSWRNLKRNKVYSAIKIGGFAVGIAACILIALFVQHELSYDKHYTQGDRIFRIANDYSDAGETDRWTNLQGPLKPVFEDHVPELELISRTVLWSWGLAGENHIRPVESDRNIYEKGFFYADPELLEILEVPMVYGDQKTALAAPNTIVISKSKADKFFPGENPLGRQLILNDNPQNTYTIGGVMEDFPDNSHLDKDFILTLFGRKYGPGNNDWCCANYTFYTRLTPDADQEAVMQKLTRIRNEHVIDELRAIGKTGLDEMEEHQSYLLQPVDHIYLNQEVVYDHLESHGSLESIWIFTGIAVAILLLACLNFINLSTAKSMQRAKEIGLRKVVGSHRSGLIYQHLSESVFYCLLSVLVGLGIAALTLPYFNQLADLSLSMPWFSWWFLPVIGLGAISIGLLSGIYPAFYLSRFNPVEAFKGKSLKAGKSLFRDSLVVFQFTITVLLIIGALTMQRQFNHYMTQSLGYEKEQVVNLHGLNSLKAEERTLLKNELERLPIVESSTLSDYLPVSGAGVQNLQYWVASERANTTGFEAASWTVDEDYIPTLGMDISLGRNFEKRTSDSVGIIINERMARGFGLDNPVGTEVIDMFDNRFQIIGVVKDFNFESLEGTVRPLAMVYGKGSNTLSVKLNSENMTAVLADVETIWNKIKPGQPIRYSFLDERFAAMYEGLMRSKSLLLVFSVLSISIACLGLFALSAYAIEQRGKEISIRKVLGASVGSLFGILSMRFIRLVLLAIVIAIPIGWWLMDDFLHHIANSIDLTFSLFAASAGLAIAIALLTVSLESVKAAIANPVKRLRSE